MFPSYDDDTPSDEDVKQTPSARDKKSDFEPNIQVIKTIVTQEDIDVFAMEERFPRYRTHMETVNGFNVEMREELYRKDPIGKVVRNDDVEGFSWLYEIPIPHYLYGECYDLYGVHGDIRAFCKSVDGNIVTIEKDGMLYTTGMCNICLNIFNHYEKWSRIPFLFKNPIYKMTSFMQEIKTESKEI